MKAKLYQQNGTIKGEIDLPEAVFGADVNEPLLHQVIVQLQANQRQGTAKTKTRAEVSGGGRKPWKQKGTGRARAGSNTSPIWVRGGKAHGATPRDYYTTIPQKLRRLALTSALSTRAKSDNVLVIDTITCDEIKTKTIATMINVMALEGKRNLLIVEKECSNIYLSGRNIKDLRIKPIAEVNAYDIIASENIIFGNEMLIEKVQEAVTL